MNQEQLTEDQIKKISYVQALLEKHIKELHEIVGGSPNSEMDVPSYCAKMARICVLHEEY